jgi:CRISPR/Cas system-associated endonuclease Cas1
MTKTSTKEDGRPSFQFYMDAWLSSFEDLRLCSPAARGVWIDMLCLMQKSVKKGALLTSKNRQYSIEELASICTFNNAKVMQNLINELSEKEVFSQLEDGTIICRRMFYKAEREEEIRQSRIAAANKRWGKKKKKSVCKSNATGNANGMQNISSRASGAGEGEEVKDKYLEYVYLSSEQFKKLEDRFGKERTQEYIERLNNYIGQIGAKKAATKYVSHYHTILSWAGKDEKEKGNNGKTENNSRIRS